MGWGYPTNQQTTDIGATTCSKTRKEAEMRKYIVAFKDGSYEKVEAANFAPDSLGNVAFAVFENEDSPTPLIGVFLVPLSELRYVRRVEDEG